MFKILLGFILGVIITPIAMESDIFKNNHDDIKKQAIETFTEFKESAIEYYDELFEEEKPS
jgi:hypothetical protein